MALARRDSRRMAVRCFAILVGRVARDRTAPKADRLGARPAPPELSRRLADLAGRLGLQRAPMAWIVPARIPPMLWVPLFGRPRLALPEELWGRLDPIQQEAILAHELAHLKRRDHWVRRLEAAVLGLYWWDPMAWWARREVERAEEECCDAWVVGSLPSAVGAYAEALVATATYLSGARRPIPLGASGVGSLEPIKRRLQMILSDQRKVATARTAPRAILVLGMLSLPCLPGLASSNPPPNPAREPAPREESALQSTTEWPSTSSADSQRQPDGERKAGAGRKSRRPRRDDYA